MVPLRELLPRSYTTRRDVIRRDDAINLPPMKSSRDFISWRMMTHVTLLRALGEGSLISASFWAIHGLRELAWKEVLPLPNISQDKCREHLD